MGVKQPYITSDKQVIEQCAKAKKLLGFVRRAYRFIQSTKTAVFVNFQILHGVKYKVFDIWRF